MKARVFLDEALAVIWKRGSKHYRDSWIADLADPALAKVDDRAGSADAILRIGSVYDFQQSG